MNTLFVSFVVAVSMLATFSSAVPLERVKRQDLSGLAIPSQFRNINIEQYLKNPRAVQFQLKCIIYDGPCDSIGKYLKANFPNWLKTQCKNCNASQKKQAGKAIEFFQEYYPREWNDAVKKYRGTFDEDDVRRFESELGIKVALEAPIPAGGVPKPDANALANLAKQALDEAKTSEAPIFETIKSAGGRSVDEKSTAAPVPASSTTSAPVSETTSASTTTTTTTSTTTSAPPSSSSSAPEVTEESTTDSQTTTA